MWLKLFCNPAGSDITHLSQQWHYSPQRKMIGSALSSHPNTPHYSLLHNTHCTLHTAFNSHPTKQTQLLHAAHFLTMHTACTLLYNATAHCFTMHTVPHILHHLSTTVYSLHTKHDRLPHIPLYYHRLHTAHGTVQNHAVVTIWTVCWYLRFTILKISVILSIPLHFNLDKIVRSLNLLHKCSVQCTSV